MPRNENIQVFTFGELSDTAKDRAKQDHQARNEFHAHDEYVESMTKLAEHFGAKFSRWEIDWTNSVPTSPPTFEVPDKENVVDVPDDVDPNDDAAYNAALDAAWEKWLKGKLDELGTYNPETLKGHGDCELTGCGTDEDCIDGFRKAFITDGERDLKELLKAAFDSMLEAGQAEYESFYENDQFEEHADANGYEYTEDGKRWRKRKAS